MLFGNKSRIVGGRSDEVFEAVIRSDYAWGTILGLASFLLLYGTFVGIFILPGLMLAPPSLSNAVLLLAYVAFPVFAVYRSRDYFVTEQILLSGEEPTLRRTYLLFSVVDSFRAERVQNLRYGGLNDGTVEFEVDGRTYWLRNRLR